jgi:uncharacterized protein
VSTTLVKPHQPVNGAASTTPPTPAPVTVDPATVKIADPGPLGLAAFAITTFLLSMVNAGFVDKAVEPVVFGVALFMGGLAQLLAGMWEYRTGNTFGATAFTAYGAFWLSFWALVQFYAADIPKDQIGAAIGLYLLAWGGFTAYMTIASFRVSRAVNVASAAGVTNATFGRTVLPTRPLS